MTFPNVGLFQDLLNDVALSECFGCDIPNSELRQIVWLSFLDVCLSNGDFKLQTLLHGPLFLKCLLFHHQNNGEKIMRWSLDEHFPRLYFIQL